MPRKEMGGAPRPIDPAGPSDGGAGGITTPEGNEAGKGNESHGNERPQEDAEELEVGDPRDGP